MPLRAVDVNHDGGVNGQASRLGWLHGCMVHQLHQYNQQARDDKVAIAASRSCRWISKLLHNTLLRCAHTPVRDPSHEIAAVEVAHRIQL